MRLNPILRKDLRLSSRSIKISIALLIYNLILLIVFFIFMLIFSNGDYEYYNYYPYRSSISTLITLFPYIVCVQSGIIGIMIPVITSGSISGERERQTLDILLTTPVKPSAIIRGKTLSAISKVMIFVISSIPIMCLSFVVGGLSWIALIKFLFIILVIAIHLGSIGIMCSALLKKSIAATTMTFVIAAFIYGGTAIFVAVVTLIFMMDNDALLIFIFNPASMLYDLISEYVYYSDVTEELKQVGEYNVIANVIGHIGWTYVVAVITLLQAWGFRAIAAKLITPYKKKSAN